VELTPRTAADPSAPASAPRRRNPLVYVVLAAALVGVGVVAYQGLTSASLYFYNADEAVEQRAELGDKRIRVQGTVKDERSTARGVAFTIAFNDVPLDVRHEGDPPELFKVGTPVVLEGRWSSDGDVFLSDEILVRHDEEYEAENEDRLEDAEDGRSGDATP
jgi:cytochrome c-type biogenesis protein CcmE